MHSDTVRIIKTISRYVLGALFVVAGINHFVMPQFYVAIMPPYLPWPAALVAISGIAEVALGASLLISRTKNLAAWGLIALLIAVFPANLHMALNPQQFPDVPYAALIARLPLQGLLILWAYWYTRPDR